MATVVNDRDVLIMGATTRYTEGTDNAALLAAIEQAKLVVFTSTKTWDFASGTESWVPVLSTFTASGGVGTYDSNSGSSSLQSPMFSIDGSVYNRVRVHMRRMAGSGWTGRLQYGTTGHGYVSTYYKDNPKNPTVADGWMILEWDMASLTSGGNDWITSTINKMLFNFATTSDDVFEIDWISIGRLAPSATGEAFEALQKAYDAIANDNILSKAEKSEVKSNWKSIVDEKPVLDAQATAFNIPKASYGSAYTALESYLAGLAPAWDDNSQDTPIDGPTFRLKFADYNTEKLKLLNALTASAVPALGRGAAINEDPMIEKPEAWVVVSGNVQRASAGGMPGVMGAMCYVVNPANGGTWLDAKVASRKRHAIDPRRVYNLSANLYAASGNNRNMYLFVNFYENETTATAITQNGWGGTMSGYTFGSLPPAGQWTRQGANFGPGTGKEIPATARYVEIGVWFHYSGEGSGSTADQAAQDIRLIDVTEVSKVQARVDSISANGVLDRSEKPETKRIWDAIWAEKDTLIAQATALKIGNTKTTYENRITELSDYLASLSPGWDDYTQDTVIDRSVFNARFNNVEVAKIALISAIGDEASRSANTDGSIRTPGGGLYLSQVNGVGGALKIRLPQSWCSTMMKFTVDIYEYTSGLTCTLEISGYNYDGGVGNQGWYNCTAVVTGASNVEYPVRFGHDGTKCCIWIGNANDTWAYPQVRVRDFFAGYSQTSKTLWESGWVISFDTNGAANVSASVLDTYPAADWRKVTGTGKPSDNATSDIVLVARNGNIRVEGNSIVKLASPNGGAVNYDVDVWSQNAYTGGAYASVVPADTTGRAFFGLDEDPWVDWNYPSIAYSMLLEAGYIYPFRFGTQLSGAIGTYVVGDVMAIQYNGFKVEWIKNNVVIYSYDAGPLSALYFDSSFGTIGMRLNNVRFLPMSSNAWAAIGGSGRPQDNATVGADASNLNVLIGGDNLCENSSFERVTNQLANGWGIYNNAGAAEPTSPSSDTGRLGGRAQVVYWDVSHNATKGIYRNWANRNGWVPGGTYIVSFYARTTSLQSVSAMTLQWNTAPASTVVIKNPALSTSWQRYVFKITWGGSVEASGTIYLSVDTGAGPGNVHFDDFMITDGDFVTSYYPSTAEAATLADWSGVGGTGKPADNATVGAPAGTNVGSTPATTVEQRANGAIQGGSGPSASINGTNLSTSKANTTVAVNMGSATVSVTGGTAPYEYQWAIIQAFTDPDGRGYSLTMSNETTATVTLTGRPVNSDTAINYTLQCTVTDANKLTATKSITKRCQFGTPT